MSYPALPDHRIPYHRDGTRVGTRPGGSDSNGFAQGVTSWLSGSDVIALNDATFTDLSDSNLSSGAGPGTGDVYHYIWLFFPESREVTAVVMGGRQTGSSWQDFVVEGSNDTTNGVDGTWETASQSGPSGLCTNTLDEWRKNIRSLSFTGPKRVLRIRLRSNTGFSTSRAWQLLHVYGEKAAGQTPDDVIFIDDNTDLEFQAALDFGDRPLGTTVARVFRLKNTSSTKTANTVNLQCNDSDFSISADGVTWVATLNFSSLAPGAETSNLYVRCTTPGPGASLGPRFAEMVVTVGSWT